MQSYSNSNLRKIEIGKYNSIELVDPTIFRRMIENFHI